MKYLASEAYYADTVGYVLWVEFFEKHSTVEEAWWGLVNSCSQRKDVSYLLPIAGPVPFELKEPIYNVLLPYTEYHELIFQSLLFSAYNVYGNLDRKKASAILDELIVDKDAHTYTLLKKKL